MSFVETLRANAHLAAWEIIDASPGPKFHCSKSVVPSLWIILGGHLRTFPEHTNNLQQMMSKSAPCAHTTVFSRHLLAEHSIEHGMKITSSKFAHVNVSQVLRQTNVTYAVTRRRGIGIWAHLDTWFGGYAVHQTVLKHHGTVPKGNDLLLFSRPDVVFSCAIDTWPFVGLATSYVMYLSHRPAAHGSGNDPSEIFMLTSHAQYSLQFSFCNVGYDGRRLVYCERSRELGCNGNSPELMVELPAKLNASVWYARKEASIGLHRMQGRGTVGIGGAYQMHAQLPLVDVTKKVHRTFPARCVGQPPGTVSRRGLMPQFVTLSSRSL